VLSVAVYFEAAVLKNTCPNINISIPLFL